MYKFICYECGTECSTPRGNETPASIFWADGHNCIFVPVKNSAHVEIIQLRAELEELKANLNLDDASTAYGRMQLKLTKLEMAFSDALGEKFLQKYG